MKIHFNSLQADFIGTWRKDRRCGAEFPLPGGRGPTECDPDSGNFCCSKWGFCGGDGEHCGCPECVNYRDKKIKEQQQQQQQQQEQPQQQQPQQQQYEYEYVEYYDDDYYNWDLRQEQEEASCGFKNF